ncbi:MAG: hypothetical protein QG604_287 [Candidatus Dependentiae bacterium]|nr:hypothetical protein [Candidatus Dependentiae bacterium]
MSTLAKKISHWFPLERKIPISGTTMTVQQLLDLAETKDLSRKKIAASAAAQAILKKMERLSAVYDSIPEWIFSCGLTEESRIPSQSKEEDGHRTFFNVLPPTIAEIYADADTLALAVECHSPKRGAIGALLPSEQEAYKKRLTKLHEKCVALAQSEDNRTLKDDIHNDSASTEQHYCLLWKSDEKKDHVKRYDITAPSAMPLESILLRAAILNHADIDTMTVSVEKFLQASEAHTFLKTLVDVKPRALSLKEKTTRLLQGRIKEKNNQKTWSLLKRLELEHAGNGTRRPDTMPDYAAFKEGMETLLKESKLSATTQKALTSKSMLVWYYTYGDDGLNDESFLETITYLTAHGTVEEVYNDPSLLAWFGDAEVPCQIHDGTITNYPDVEAFPLLCYPRPALLSEETEAKLLKNLTKQMDSQKRRPGTIAKVTALLVGLSFLLRYAHKTERDLKTAIATRQQLANNFAGVVFESQEALRTALAIYLETKYNYSPLEVEQTVDAWLILLQNPTPDEEAQAQKVITRMLGARWSIPAKIARLFKKKK